MFELLIGLAGAVIGYTFALIQTIVKSKYDLKMKRLEVYETKRIETLSEFLYKAEIAVRSEMSTYVFNDVFSSAVVYMDKNQARLAYKFREHISKRNAEEARKSLDDLVASLHKRLIE